MVDALAEGRAALAALDRALGRQPNKDPDDFTAVVEHLCIMRDRLIADGRSGADHREHLGTVNALISVVLSGRFPLGTVSWPLIESGRTALAGLLQALPETDLPARR